MKRKMFTKSILIYCLFALSGCTAGIGVSSNTKLLIKNDEKKPVKWPKHHSCSVSMAEGDRLFYMHQVKGVWINVKCVVRFDTYSVNVFAAKAERKDEGLILTAPIEMVRNWEESSSAIRNHYKTGRFLMTKNDIEEVLRIVPYE